MNMNDISFTSKINFVDRKAFDNFRKGTYIDFRPNGDMNALDMFSYNFLKKICGNRIKNPRLDVMAADEFYTDSVRTCTAGGVVNTKTGEAVGFHIYDSLDNMKKVDNIIENIFGWVNNPDRAIILGSKNLKITEYSIPIFKNLYEGISKRVKNVTAFKEHVFPFSESDIHYSAKTDTWTIRSMFRPLTDIKEIDVQSKDDLSKAFKKIEVADGDIITFGG